MMNWCPETNAAFMKHQPTRPNLLRSCCGGFCEYCSISQLRALTRLYRCRIPMTAWQWTVAASSHIKQKSIVISAWHVLTEKFHDTWIKLDIIGYQLIIYSNLTLRCLQLLCNHTEHFYVDTVEPRWREWWSQVALIYDICLCRWYKGIR